MKPGPKDSPERLGTAVRHAATLASTPEREPGTVVEFVERPELELPQAA